MFLPALLCVSVCVCVPVTTITKKIVGGFVPNLWEGSETEREDQVRLSLRSVEGCECNGQGVLCLPQNFAFTGSCTLSQSTFHLVCHTLPHATSAVNPSFIMNFLRVLATSRSQTTVVLRST